MEKFWLSKIQFAVITFHKNDIHLYVCTVPKIPFNITKYLPRYLKSICKIQSIVDSNMRITFIIPRSVFRVGNSAYPEAKF